MKNFDVRYKIIAAMIITGCVGVTACSFDQDRFNRGLEKIESAVVGTEETTVETEETEETEAEEETEETEVTPEPTATATPSPTSTPTPSPTPMPERVDFSELTEDSLMDDFDVELEAFEQTYSGDSNLDLVSFTGNRMLVSLPENTTVQTSINSMLNGLYSEAEGLYNRCCDEADAEYALSGRSASRYSVTVDYSYSGNDRLLSVDMSYEVSSKLGGVSEVLAETTEHITFDMYTGQVITIDSVAKDSASFRQALVNALNNANVAEEDTDEDETAETTETTAATEERTYDEIWITVQSAANGTSVCKVNGISNGEVYSTLIDMNDYSDYLTRFGLAVYGTDDEPELIFEEETEETEETEEIDGAEETSET